MPSISDTGRILSSSPGQGIIAVDRVPFDTGGVARWIDANRIIYQRADNRVVITALDKSDIHAGDEGANETAAGGGCWATWLAGVGLRHSLGGLMGNAGLKDVGRDGTLALCPNRQSGVGLNFIALQDADAASRRFLNFEGVVADSVHVHSWGNAVWKNGAGATEALISGRIIAIPTIAPVFRPRLLSVDGEWWITYNTNEAPRGRTLLHPITVTEGYVIADGDSQFGLDALALDANRILFAWAATEGEDPAGITVAEFNLKTHRLSGAGDDRILAYEKLTRRTSVPPVVVVPKPKPVDPPKPTEKKPVQLTARQQDIVQQLHDKFPEWANAKGENQDDERRKLAKVIAQQFRHEFGEAWGWKSNHGNTENDTPSKDAIAMCIGPYKGGRQELEIFDLFNGTTRQPNNPCFSETKDREQCFVPVQPLDTLGVSQPRPEEPKVDEPQPEQPKPSADIEARLKTLEDNSIVFNRNDQVLSADAQTTARAITEMKTAIAALQADVRALNLGTPATPTTGAATEATLTRILALLEKLAAATKLPLAA